MSSSQSPSRPAEDLRRLRCLRADLSRMMEPGDALAGVTLQVLGVEGLHQLISSGARAGSDDAHRVALAAEEAGLRPRQRRIEEGLARWRTRLPQAQGATDIRRMRLLDGGLLIPEDAAWPSGLQDLGPASPVALWYRGASPASDGSPSPGLTEAIPAGHRAVAIVGSREITDYGRRVATEFAGELTAHGISVVSGGAYGVDAMAHRAALRAAGAPTAAVLAGGLDRWYPAGNEGLLREIASSGLLLGEMPLGAAPTRHRFLQRNRLIAALTSATVIIEARWRSGAQSTAHHALSLGRSVGAVPGSIHSASSAGCHRLLRETPAEIVVDPAGVVELMAGSRVYPVKAPEASVHAMLPGLSTAAGAGPGDGQGADGPLDSVSDADRVVFDALPVRRLSDPSKLSEIAGLPVRQVLAGLSRLQRLGLARMVNGQWGRQGE